VDHDMNPFVNLSSRQTGHRAEDQMLSEALVKPFAEDKRERREGADLRFSC
jgi:hypothetical protein